MATESGVGGKIRKGSTHLCATNWQLESNPNLQEDTCAENFDEATDQAHVHRVSIKMDHKLTIEVNIASGHQPEDDGITEGAEVAMYLRVGNLKAYNNWDFIIDTVNLVGNDANGLARYTVTMYAQEAKPALGIWSES